MRIDIWSDVICPWCFLGKRRFEQAVARLDAPGSVDIRWRAFQLDPSARTEPSDLRRSIERKYGPGAFDGMVSRLTALGAADGIDYRFDLAQRVNTVDAHRLVAWARDAADAEGQSRLVERLFVAYFEQGANVADHATLTRLASESGLDGVAAASVLAEDLYRDEVASDLEAAVERELTGVPAFVIEDRLLVPGAQEVETFERVLSRAIDRFS